MSDTLIDVIGYFAIVINLYSMSTKGEYKLRLFSIVANSIYIIYGILIHAFPVIIGGAIAVFLHTYRIKNLSTHKPPHD